MIAKTEEYDLRKLLEPFPANDIEWRIQSAGLNDKGEPWGKVLAYVTARAIQDRLDNVVGPMNWRNEFTTGPGGGVLCGISIRDPHSGEWITKWDGADNTDFEAVKGGLSGAEKRAAVQWGIGRYLYNLPVGWAQVCTTNMNRQGAKYHYSKTKDKKDVKFYWHPPALPDWALPESERGQQPRNGTPPKKEETHRQTNGHIMQMLANIGNGAREHSEEVFRFVTGGEVGRDAALKDHAAAKLVKQALEAQIESMQNSGQDLAELVTMAREAQEVTA